MYAQYFQLREMPFSISPDPAYLYMSPRHQEALGHLLYGTGQYGGFVQLTGEVGTGKTTIVRTLLEQKLEGVEVAMVHNPRQSEAEFVQSICDELGVEYRRDDTPSLKSLIDALNQHLLRTHANDRRTVLIIDEAQNLSPAVLEQVRLLTNLETNKEKLLRIMLVGQPELADLLARPDLRQLASRITARYHLTPLEQEETAEYVRHRLRVAGTQESLFTAEAIKEIQRFTRGVPRLINVLCDRALLGAYGKHQRQVTRELVRGAAAEVFGRGVGTAPAEAGASVFWRRLRRSWDAAAPQPGRTWIQGVLVAIGLTIVGVLIYGEMSRDRQPAPVNAAPEVAQAPSPPVPASVTAPATSPVAAALPTASVSPATPRTVEELLGLTPALPQLTDRLIRLWDADIKIARGDNVCRSLRSHGLECYRTDATFPQLRRMDRPAVLTVIDAAGQTRYALVTQLTDERAWIETSEGSQDMALDDLGSAWTGEMFLLWRRETVDVLIEYGERGAGVVWLRERLAQMMGKPASTESDIFDGALLEEVRLFQGARGLASDGIVGVQTRIALSDLAPGTPTLKFKP
ncbi:MAG: AAA family ATPase [Panacagrimonas sp.]